MDLAIMDKLSSDNKGMRNLLVCIDLFSKFVRVEPMKDKFSQTTVDAFKKMTNNLKIKPEKLWTDEGKEFAGQFKAFCSDHDILIYHTFSDQKASPAERAIRSLKNLIYRYIEENQTYNYIKDLQKLVNILNSRANRSLGGKAPKDVTNEDYLRVHYTPASYRKTKRFAASQKFKVGDHVRITKKDMPFRKGYQQQFTNEVFKVVNVATITPVRTYELEALDGEIICGKFYGEELIKVRVKTNKNVKQR